MKITKSQLKQIIKEELEQSGQPGFRELFEDFVRVVNMATMNKSFGFSPETTQIVLEELEERLEDLLEILKGSV